MTDRSITINNIDLVLAESALFERGYSTWCFDRRGYSAEFITFQQLLEDNNFIQPFDWTEWHATFRRTYGLFPNDPMAFTNADLETVVQLITFMLRAHRLNQGYLAQLVYNGFFHAFMRRLAQLRQEIEPQPVYETTSDLMVVLP